MAFTRREQIALLTYMGNPAQFGIVVERAKGVSLDYKIRLLSALHSSGGDPDELVALITAEHTGNGRAAEPPRDGPQSEPAGRSRRTGSRDRH